MLGDTDAEAAEQAAPHPLQQVSPQTAITLLEQVWNRDLSAYDPDGPLPDVEPGRRARPITAGPGPPRRPEGRRRRSGASSPRPRSLSIRELVIEVTSRQPFVGTPAQVADEIDLHVQADAGDGFILVPHLTPRGLDEFVDRVVPLLQERGVFRTEYGATPCAITSAYRLARGVGGTGGGMCRFLRRRWGGCSLAAPP